MITFFNKFANSWGAKIILGFLTLSMIALWGLGGLTNINMYNNDAITVGKVSISTQQVAQRFDQERKDLSAKIGGKYISPAQALEIGLLQKVIQEEIYKQVQYQIKEDLGLSASNEAVQKYVENNPLFKDALGNFDKNIFYAFLSQRGLSETGLAYQLKEELSYNHLKDTVSDLSYETTPINKLSYLSSNEMRDVTALFLKPDDLAISEQPSPEDLTSYYEAYSENFMKPEYRKIRLMQLTPATMEKFILISEEEIAQNFEFEKTKYDQPEERELLQILFKTKEEAQSAQTDLTPANFEEKAASFGQTKEATYFGMTQKNQLAEALQEPVFTAAKGTLTQPIETELGWQIFYIKEIKEATKTDENTIKAEIRKNLINNKAYDKLAEISRKIEDLLGEGKSLAETAATLSLETKELPFLDVAGIDISGQSNEFVTPDLMQEIFTLKQGEISSLIEHNNGYLIGEIVEIDPVGSKPFESVKNEVINLFKAEKQKEIFAKVVEDLTQKAKSGVALDKLSNGKEGSFKLEKATALTRMSNHNLFKPHLSQIFAQEKGLQNTSFVLAPNNQGAVIFTVDTIQTPDFNQNNVDLTATKIDEKQINSQALNEAIFNDYLNKLKVKVNQKAINQIISLYKNQE
ncbi:MAG: SurA N-terminal domain-containing protein [Alphaproteobacteria bacterium]|nr:SurA N-terminal domain-containing protein [Alphaproteobacteria bacterium]